MSDSLTTSDTGGPDNSFLGKVNTTLTALGAIIGTIAAMLASGAKDEAKDAKSEASGAKQAVENLEQRERLVEANYKFADIFLKHLKANGGDDGVKTASSENGPHPTNDRQNEVRAMLPVLDIVARASSNDEGDSPAELRAILPIYIALMKQESGAVAAMDDQLEHLDRWKIIAAVDGDDRTRLTAIQALVGICKWACMSHDKVRVERACKAIKDLLDLVSTETDLQSLIQRADTLVALGRLDSFLNGRCGDQTPRDFADAAAARRQDIVIALTQLKKGIDPMTRESLAKGLLLTQEQTLRVEVLLRALGGETDDASQSARASDPSTTVAGVANPVAELLKDLTSDVTKIRRGARTKLGSFGQEAVRPLFEALNGVPWDRNTASEYKMRLGIATALRNLKQPIQLNKEELAAAIKLFSSNDPETRLAILDFLINLEDTAAIQWAYKQLVALVNGDTNPTKKPDPQKDGPAVVNAVTVIGGWLTALTSTDPAITELKITAKEQLEDWKIGKLAGPEWAQSRSRIDRALKAK